MRANEFIVENNKSRTEEFQGVHMKIRDDGYEVVASALNDWGNEMGSVVFNKGDGNELDPQDLLVIDKYRGQGIAKVMYDYVKSKGYEIHKSYDVTRIADQGKESGEYFWQKNRGEERVWEGVPQPGPSSGAPKQFGSDAKIQTRQMTVKDIISSIPGVPYYNNVVDDYDAKDYSWGVTKKSIEYANYLKQNPKSLLQLPPILVLNGKFEDGAHRVSAIWLLQQRMDPKNPLWKNAKLNVQFVQQDVAENELEEDWKSKLATGAMAGAMAMGGAHATGPEWTERPDGSIVKTVKQVGNTIKDKLTPSFMKKDSIAKAEPGISLLSRNNPEAEEVLHTTALKAGLRGAELAQFLAQTRHESADFAHMHEIGNKQRFAKYETPRLAKQLGNKYKGDGERFKGRGFIQLTGRDNYTRASEQIFGDDRLVKNPNLASRFDIASQIALWYWKNQVKPYVNNFNDTKAVTKAINPAMRGLQDRHDNFKQYMAVL